MFHFTRHLVSPLTGAKFPPLNVGCLLTVHCEGPLFPKCGNISQPDQFFHPQQRPSTTCHGLVQREKDRTVETARRPFLWVGCHPHQQKHFQFPKCQWAITVKHLTHRNYIRASERPAVYQPFLGIHEDLSPGVRERTMKVPRLAGQSPPTVLWLLIGPALLLPS